MKRRAGGAEHRLTQRITLQCPVGHKLAAVNAALVDLAAGFGTSAGVGAHPARVDLARRRFVFRCEGCARASRRTCEYALTFQRVASVLAAQYCYGPAHVTLPATVRGVSDTLARIIPEGDPARIERRQLFDAVAADLVSPGSSLGQMHKGGDTLQTGSSKAS